MAEEGIPRREDLRKLKVVQLRHQLSEAGLPQTGLKENLITRLLNHYKEQAERSKVTQAEESPEPAGSVEEGDGGPGDEGAAMDVSTEGGEREEGGKKKEEEEDGVRSLPAEQPEEREEPQEEKVLVEERTEDEEVAQETAMEEDAVIAERQDGATAEATSASPVPTHPVVAEVEPQTGQREPPGAEPSGSRDQTTDTELAPHITEEDPKDPLPTHDDDKTLEVSAEPSDPEPFDPQAAMEEETTHEIEPQGTRESVEETTRVCEPQGAQESVEETTRVCEPQGAQESVEETTRESEPQGTRESVEESTRESEPQGARESVVARDSGVEEADSEPSDKPSSNLVDQPPPPPLSTSSDYFSDSTRDDDPVRSQTEIRVTPTATPPHSSQIPSLVFQSSNGPQTFTPPSLESIPLPPQAPPPPQMPPQAKQWRQPAVASEQKSGEAEPKGKRKKKKRRRRRRRQSEGTANSMEMEDSKDEPEVEIEYVQEDILHPGDPNYRQFHKIFEMFKISEPEKKAEPHDSAMDLVAKAVEASKKMAAAIAVEKRRESSDEEEEAEVNKELPKISKKKLRKMNRLSVAQLKQLVERPDVVEMHDVTAQDPRLLVHLKSTRNTVPVPRHWCFKRKYLQGKRGIEKPPFDLPDFIKATGIMEMRQALEEKEEAKSLKQKTRERVRPKMGKLTIDYQKLHDAFFKWQTKPKMSIHGDLYYEGKEFETRLKEKKPGDITDELRRALGMPTGQGKQKFPPPWLVAMQRYGPPPSYPNLKIHGLNAPIPEGCSFGYFVGGWGKPPVDETGRPLYGDVFGLDQPEMGGAIDEDEVDRALWGEMESEEEEEESSSEEEEQETKELPKPEEIQAGLITPIEGLVTPSGLTSIPAGLETPEMIQLRKKKIEEAMEQGGETPVLYTVLPEKPTAVGAAMMGSAHVYDIAAAMPGATKKAGSSAPDGVEVALDPSELDLDTATMTARYEEQLKEQRAALQKEDLSDMVAEHAAKQKKRKRAATDSGGKASKKLKEFKF